MGERGASGSRNVRRGSFGGQRRARAAPKAVTPGNVDGRANDKIFKTTSVFECDD